MAAAHIASDEEVLAAAKRILKAERSIQTQGVLGRLVNRELAKEPDAPRVTPSRVRRLVAQAPFARLELKARRGPKEKVLNACPVCSGRLDRVKNQTLFGGEVTLVLRCPQCGYWTGKEKRIPTRYVFHLKG